MYRVQVSNAAAKILQKFYKSDPQLYHRFIAVFESLSRDPYQGKKLKGQFLGDYSICLGTYRIIYTIRKSELVVYIIDLGHRREIYR